VNDPSELLTVKEAAAYPSTQYKLFITSCAGAQSSASPRQTMEDQPGLD
jgi:hypothetical protein